MAVEGVYSGAAFQADPAALRTAIREVFAAPAAALAAEEDPPTADEQADALADAITGWLRGVRLVVRVYPIGGGGDLAVAAANPGGDVALQTAAAPGSPTLAPAATIELLGELLISEG